MFPNPAHNNAIISITGISKPVTITILDIAGKVLQKYNNVSSNQYQLRVNNLSNGMYLITVSNGKEIKQLKLIKQ